MDELFTGKAKAALVIAQEEAKSFRHQSVGSEHLLLALVIEEGGIAGKLLRQAGVNEKDVKEEIEKLTGYGKGKKIPLEIYLPYSPRAKKILAFAGDESKRLGAPNVGTEHLLLGLLREDDILAARILESFGLDLPKTRQLFLKKIGVTDVKGNKQNMKKMANQPRPTEEGDANLRFTGS